MTLLRYIFLFKAFLFSVSVQVLAQVPESVVADSTSNNYVKYSTSTLHDSIIDYSKLFLKTPYRYGSPGEKSFDCSGFTSYIFRNFGYKLDRSSADQAHQTPTVNKVELRKGDLVFFEGRRKNGRVGHVGIVVDAFDSGHFNFIHAAVRTGVVISNSREPYYAQRFVKAGRILGADSIIQRQNVFPELTINNTSLSYNQNIKTKPAKFHKVKKGDNLSSIAQKHGVSVAHIKKLNHLKSSNLQINQQLKIKEKTTVEIPERQIVQSNTTSGQLQSTEESICDDSIQTKPTIENFSDKKIANQTLTTTKTSDKKITENKNHKVTKGESLYSIARQYNVTIEELKRINNLNSGSIFPGQLLKTVNENSTTVEVIQTEKKQTKTLEHKVSAGESLYSIARKYNVTVDKIKSTNHLNNSKIQSGQILLIDSEKLVL